MSTYHIVSDDPDMDIQHAEMHIKANSASEAIQIAEGAGIHNIVSVRDITTETEEKKIMRAEKTLRAHLNRGDTYQFDNIIGRIKYKK